MGWWISYHQLSWQQVSFLSSKWKKLFFCSYYFDLGQVGFGGEGVPWGWERPSKNNNSLLNVLDCIENFKVLIRIWCLITHTISPWDGDQVSDESQWWLAACETKAWNRYPSVWKQQIYILNISRKKDCWDKLFFITVIRLSRKSEKILRFLRVYYIFLIIGKWLLIAITIPEQIFKHWQQKLYYIYTVYVYINILYTIFTLTAINLWNQIR